MQLRISRWGTPAYIGYVAVVITTVIAVQATIIMQLHAKRTPAKIHRIINRSKPPAHVVAVIDLLHPGIVAAMVQTQFLPIPRSGVGISCVYICICKGIRGIGTDFGQSAKAVIIVPGEKDCPVTQC